MSRLIQWLRESRFFRSEITKRVLILAFPIVLYWFAELGQCQNLSQMLSFTWNRFRVALFGCLLVAAIFWTLAFLVRRVWISAAVTGLLFMTISTVEYHKYYVTGCHLLFSDLIFVKGIADVSKFARLHFNVLLLCTLHLAHRRPVERFFAQAGFSGCGDRRCHDALHRSSGLFCTGLHRLRH